MPCWHRLCMPIMGKHSNTTSSTKPEVHNVMHYRERTEPWPQLTCTENLEFGWVVFEICKWIQDKLIAILCIHTMGQSNNYVHNSINTFKAFLLLILTVAIAHWRHASSPQLKPKSLVCTDGACRALTLLLNVGTTSIAMPLYSNNVTLQPITHHHTTPQLFYSPFSGTTRVSWWQKRTSGPYGARED